MSKAPSLENLNHAGAMAELVAQRLQATVATKEAMKKYATAEQRQALNNYGEKILSAIFSEAADREKVVYEVMIARAELWVSVLSQVEENKLNEQVSAYVSRVFKNVAEKKGTAHSDVFQLQNAPTLGKIAFAAMQK